MQELPFGSCADLSNPLKHKRLVTALQVQPFLRSRHLSKTGKIVQDVVSRPLGAAIAGIALLGIRQGTAEPLKKVSC